MAPLMHSTAALLERKRVDELRERSEALKAERLARESQPAPKSRQSTAAIWREDLWIQLRQFNAGEISLSEIYEKCAPELAEKHPESHSVQPSIRHALQGLRDEGRIIFVRPGVYRKAVV